DISSLYKALEDAVASTEKDSWSRISPSSSPTERLLTSGRTPFDDCEVDRKLLRMDRKVASGSCGDLYRGTYLGQDVAIKVLKPERLNEALRQECVQEIMILRLQGELTREKAEFQVMSLSEGYVARKWVQGQNVEMLIFKKTSVWHEITPSTIELYSRQYRAILGLCKYFGDVSPVLVPIPKMFPGGMLRGVSMLHSQRERSRIQGEHVLLRSSGRVHFRRLRWRTTQISRPELSQVRSRRSNLSPGRRVQTHSDPDHLQHNPATGVIHQVYSQRRRTPFIMMQNQPLAPIAPVSWGVAFGPLNLTPPMHDLPKGRRIFFLKFFGDGKQNPGDHLTAFFISCGVLAIEHEDVSVRLFIETLHDLAGEWFYRLAPSTITNWATMRDAFLRRFKAAEDFSTLITQLTQLKEPHEHMWDFIAKFQRLLYKILASASLNNENQKVFFINALLLEVSYQL
ncbi:hypothetical protein KI387_018672, partial [Taxus chinensis]